MDEPSLRSYADVIHKCKELGNFTIAVAVAQDRDVLKAIKAAEVIGLANAILVGKHMEIADIVKELDIRNARIINEEDDIKAAQISVGLLTEHKADILMKGLINTSDFLRAVLETSKKQPGFIMSHLGVFEIPGQKKLLFMTDGGMNINPDLHQKVGILNNAIKTLNRLGITNPKVAILTANEKVHPKMQSTVDAQELVQMRTNGAIPAGIIEGPIALDVAVSADAAKHKGIQSAVSGDVDLYLVPTIDAGNIWGKSMIYFSSAKMAGLVVGAEYPIVLTSRAETPEGKLNSIALACLTSRSSTER